MTKTSNEGVVRKIYDEFNRGEDWIGHFVADSATYVDFSGRTHGKEDMRKFFESFLRGFPDGRGRIDRTISQGNMVVVEYTLWGTHSGEFAGIPATGKKFEYKAIEIYDFEAGKVKHLNNFMKTDEPIWLQYLRFVEHIQYQQSKK